MEVSVLLGKLETKMIDFYNKYQGNTHSQNGEDGVLTECLQRMGIEKGTCAEWGAHNGIWCSNTALLIEKGWEALLVEYDNKLHKECSDRYAHYGKVVCHNFKITPANINSLIDKEYDVISVDTDGGNDYQCFLALKCLSKILIIEINSGFKPDVWHVSEEKGASYKAMVELGIEKGYFLLCHTGNLVFVKNEYRGLFPEIIGNGLSNSELYFNNRWL
jgi:hypothetical protein